MANAVFIPFPTKNSAEHIQSTAGGFTTEIVDKLGKIIPRDIEAQTDQFKPTMIMTGWGKVAPDKIVCADSGNLRAVLGGLTQDDTLYLRGHCTAGAGVLQSSDHTMNVDIPTIVSHLTGKLPRVFAGKLKVYACESGAGSGMLWWKQESFAKKLSDAMIAGGWLHCSYYGYTKELSTYVVNGHKRTKDHSERASARRVRVA